MLCEFLSIRGSNPVAQKVLFSVSSGVFLLAIRKYYCVEETPDYAKTKAFWVLRSFKMPYFCRYKEKNEAMLSLARLFDAVTAKRGLFKTVPGSTILCVYSSEHAEEFFVFKKGLDKMRRMGGNY